jgi:hypothetical protein
MESTSSSHGREGVADPRPGRHAPPVTDELEAELKRRDAGFIIRIVLRLSVLVLVIIWAVNALGEHQVGGCVADAFRAVTGEPAPR